MVKSIDSIPMDRFNPRARDGRDAVYNLIIQNNKVSIHAPVMDAMWLV